MITALTLAAVLATGAQTTPPPTDPVQTPPAQETPAGTTTGPRPVRSIETANLLLQRMRKEAYSPSSHFYGEEWELGRKPSSIAYSWTVSVLLSGLASAAKTDPKLKEPLLELANSSAAYWNDEGPVAGYDILPGPKVKDRYYDDNAWMTIALTEAYDATKKVDLLVRARESFAYVLSGETKDLDGGVFWRESDRATKNSASTAPAAYAALALYDRTKDKRYLADAVRLYRWADEKLRDPADSLMWDSISADGTKIERAKWSYNTALMLKTEQALLDLKAIPSLTRTQLLQHAEAAATRWVLPTGGFRDEAQFAHMLFEALVMVDTPAYPPALAQKTLAFLRDEAVDKAGHYGPRWESKNEGPVMKPKLIHQAAAMRAFAFAAERNLNPQ